MYLVTWMFGYELWKKPLPLPYGISYGNIMELSLHISALSNIPTAIYNIYKSYKDKTGKMRPFNEAIRPLYNLATFMFISMFWVYNSPNDIMNTDPRAVYILSGTIFSNISVSIL